MAWYLGGGEAWRGVPVCDLGKFGSVELLYALNERVSLLRQMPSMSTAGTFATTAYPWDTGLFPVYSDLSGKPLLSWRTCFLLPLREAIEANVTNFAKVHTQAPPEITAFADYHELLALGSYGNEWLPCTRVHDTDVWIQVQEALENMTYPIGESAISDWWAVSHYYSGYESTAAGAWAASRALGTYETHQPSGGDGAHYMERYYTTYFKAYCGVHVREQIVYPDSWPSFVDFIIGFMRYYQGTYEQADWVPKTSYITPSLGASTITLETWGSGVFYTPCYLVSGLPTGSQTNYLTWSPSVHPWDEVTGYHGDVHSHLNWGSAVCPHLSTGDITAELTYG